MTRRMQIVLPQLHVPGKPLGRHINHDPESLRYLVPETDTVVSKMWRLVSANLNQGSVGSCTGNALVDVLGSDPYIETVPEGIVLDEQLALEIYGDAEKIDGGMGYPPEDQGSSGLSAAKAAKARGLISGYLHATSIAACHTAIQSGPFLVGSYWYTGMDSPNPQGVVVPSGSIRGGHEYECYGYDAGADLWWFRNSWGPSFGVAGNFAMSTASFTKLLASYGDATMIVPLSQPAPTPSPAPGDPTSAFVAQAKEWTAHRHEGHNAAFAKDVNAWLSATGNG